MSCGLVDIGCHVSTALAPAAALWAQWDWALAFVAGLIIGGILGWRVILAMLTLGVGYLIYDRMKTAPDPAYETGEPEPAPPPKKRKGIFGR